LWEHEFDKSFDSTVGDFTERWANLLESMDTSKKPKPTKSLEDWDITYDWNRFAEDTMKIHGNLMDGLMDTHKNMLSDYGACHEYKDMNRKCVTGHNMEKLKNISIE